MARELLAILGASRLYRGYYERARALGFATLALDRDPQAACAKDADSFEPVDITDQEGVLGACRQYGVGGILAVNDFGLEALAFAAAALDLPGHTPDTVARCINKELMRSAWREAGLPNPYFCAVETLEAAIHAAEKGPGYPYVLKPINSRGGGQRGVSVAAAPADLPAAFAFARNAYSDGGVLIEECLRGTEHTLEAFMHRGELFALTYSDRYKFGEVYRVDKTIAYPSELPAADLAAASSLARDLILTLGIENGAVHLEFCRTEGGIVPFELGARGGGGAISTHIVPYVTGVDFAGAMIRSAMGHDPGDIRPEKKGGAVIRFLSAPPGLFVGLEGTEALEDTLDHGLICTPGDTLREIRVGGDRLGYFVTGAASNQQSRTKADNIEAALRFIVAPLAPSQARYYREQ